MNTSFDLLKAEENDETIKLNYNRKAVFAANEFFQKSYVNTEVLRRSFKDLIHQYSGSAVMMCQVNAISFKNKELT